MGGGKGGSDFDPNPFDDQDDYLDQQILDSVPLLERRLLGPNVALKNRRYGQQGLSKIPQKMSTDLTRSILKNDAPDTVLRKSLWEVDGSSLANKKFPAASTSLRFIVEEDSENCFSI